MKMKKKGSVSWQDRRGRKTRRRRRKLCDKFNDDVAEINKKGSERRVLGDWAEFVLHCG